MLVKTLSRISSRFHDWVQDTTGVVAMVVIFCLPAFVAAAGVAVDLAQAYNLKTRLSAALDKAALAAGNTTGTNQEIHDRITAFITANYPEAALGDTFDLTVNTPSGTVDLSAHARVQTVFMNIFGQQFIDVFAESIVKKEVSGLELVLVLDNTGSMADPAGGGVSKIDAAKTAANTLLNILYGSNANVPKLYVGVVPFSMDVNIGPTHGAWTPVDTYNYGPAGWAGCVEARYTSGRDITVDTPAIAKFPKYYYACSSSSNLWYWTVNSTDYATNGNFGVATGWTQGGWSISGGKLLKTTPTNIVTNGTFATNSGWTFSSNSNWTITGGLLTKTSQTVQTNGDFSSATGWTLGSNWTISGGVLTKSNTTSSATATETASPALVVNDTYESTYTINSHSGNGKVNVTVGNKSGASNNGSSTYCETLTPSASGSTIGFSTANTFKGTIDNFSVRHLVGTTGTPATVTQTPGTALSAGSSYTVVYTVSGYVGCTGSVQVTIGGTAGTARSANGTYTETIVAGAGTTIGFKTTDGFDGSIDNFTVTLLSTGPVTETAASSLNSSADYLVSYTIDSRTAGSVYATVGGARASGSPTYSTPGLVEEVINAGSSNQLIGLTTSDSFLGQIDNFSVKLLSACGSGPTYHYASTLDENLGPNKYCVKPSLPMTPTKSDVVSTINSLTAAGSTMIQLGMAWGWRMLDPSWRGTWDGTMADATSPGPLPLNYNYSGMNKAVILMTDGDNTYTNYSAYGTSSSNLSYSGSCSYGTGGTALENCKTRDVCNAMKAQNILIYTIALGQDLNSTSLSMLRDCATSPAYAFTSPTTNDLTSTFTTIANQLNSLYIVY